MASLQDLFNAVKGTPYLLGSAGGRTDFTDHPSRFDCSGFVAWAFYKASGGSVKLPAYTDSIASAPGVTKLGPSDVPQPGDIVLYRFYDPEQPNARYPHTAIYAGNGMVVQSGGTGHGVNAAPVNQFTGATFFRVQGAPAFSNSTPAPSTSPTAPVTAPFVPPAGVTPPANAQQPIGGGASSGSSVSADNPEDWVSVDLGPLGKHKFPTARGVVDMLASAIKSAVESSWQAWGIPAVFYVVGGVVVLVGLVGLAMQALDAGSASVQQQSARPSVKLAGGAVSALRGGSAAEVAAVA